MKQRLFGAIFFIIILTAGMVLAYSSGPPNGRTGAPGESNCTVGCHSSFQLNSGPGTLSITGPETYAPNETLILTVDLAQTGQDRWGFEAVVLDANNNQVGFIMLDDPNRTQISTDVITGREYIKQNSLGTDNGTPNASPGWEFHWVAPSVDVGPVTIYASGNASDGNGFTSGDYIYTTTKTIQPEAVSCCVGIRGNIDNDPNDIIDIGDLVYFVTFSFGGGPVPVCSEEADVDASGVLDIGDIVYMVTFMFGGGPAPLSC